MCQEVQAERAVRRRWFEGKGDVWRLLQDVSDAIDGRSWPEDHAVEVCTAPSMLMCARGTISKTVERSNALFHNDP